MKKNLDWLKKKLRVEVGDLILFDGLTADRANQVLDGICRLLDQTEFSQNSYLISPIVVPRWFAKWCEGRVWGESIHEGEHYTKEDLRALIEIASGENLHGLTGCQAKEIESGFFKYLTALQGGYTVEEGLYYVLDEKNGVPMLAKREGVVGHSGTSVPISETRRDKMPYKLTEEEIKSYGKRYWAFSVPVEE